ncbi:pyridoxamine 5'-phosphate oxidase family protein [Mycobacterium sp. 1245805.9]|uniref:pyridoxamine 5'-phosphate oxidase family protein n=1 Tax=Mycobacterium sp. 1245805.9 TaxID=1856862 RepID=UPI0007FC374D|nr:pyridoxamine 5'-phosphate oxidase family protein [Mycobacterium sp. 1245805.9]OBI83754.1 pyridoxamine 5'-phosphate oxidase [Mycobacterium sp. 1245805.9]
MSFEQGSVSTRLDERFSDAGTQPTTWAAACEVLTAAQVSWLSTVRSDGRPHVTPLVAVWLDGVLYFGTGETEQKGVNLAHNPNVVLTTGCNTWDRGLDVVVEGKARRVVDRSTLERLAVAWLTKWKGAWDFEATDAGFHRAGIHSLVFAVEPSKVLAFGRQRLSRPAQTMLASVAFTHTRHRP